MAREGLLREEYHPGLLQVGGVAAYHLGEILDALEGRAWSPRSTRAQLTLADRRPSQHATPPGSQTLPASITPDNVTVE